MRSEGIRGKNGSLLRLPVIRPAAYAPLHIEGSPIDGFRRRWRRSRRHPFGAGFSRAATRIAALGVPRALPNPGAGAGVHGSRGARSTLQDAFRRGSSARAIRHGLFRLSTAGHNTSSPRVPRSPRTSRRARRIRSPGSAAGPGALAPCASIGIGPAARALLHITRALLRVIAGGAPRYLLRTDSAATPGGGALTFVVSSFRHCALQSLRPAAGIACSLQLLHDLRLFSSPGGELRFAPAAGTWRPAGIQTSGAKRARFLRNYCGRPGAAPEQAPLRSRGSLTLTSPSRASMADPEEATASVTSIWHRGLPRCCSREPLVMGREAHPLDPGIRFVPFLGHPRHRGEASQAFIVGPVHRALILMSAVQRGTGLGSAGERSIQAFLPASSREAGPGVGEIRRSANRGWMPGGRRRQLTPLRQGRVPHFSRSGKATNAFQDFCLSESLWKRTLQRSPRNFTAPAVPAPANLEAHRIDVSGSLRQDP